MSRAGKHPIKLKDGVSAVIADNVLVIKGPKGEIKLSLVTKNSGLVDVVVEAAQVFVSPNDAEDKKSRAMWGTMEGKVRRDGGGGTDGFLKQK